MMLQPRLEHHAMKGFYRCYVLEPDTTFVDAQILGQAIENKMNELHLAIIKELKLYKIQIRLKVLFYKVSDRTLTIDAYFNSNQHTILKSTNFNLLMTDVFVRLNKKLENFVQRDTGLAIDMILELRVCVSKIRLVRGGCEQIHSSFNRNKGVINVQPSDDRCFVLSILCSLYHHNVSSNKCRASNYYKYLSTLNLQGLKFPLALSQVPKFEKQNNVSVFISAYNSDDGYYPIYRSKVMKSHHVNLLYIDSKNNDGGIGHYCSIINLDQCIGSSLSRHKRKKYHCPRCLSPFSEQLAMKQHCTTNCFEMKQKVLLPGETNGKRPIMRFQKFNAKIPNGLLLIADFESLLQKQNIRPTSSSCLIEKHVPSSFCIQPVYQMCEHSAIVYDKSHLYRGRDCIDQFMRTIIASGESFQKTLANKAPLIITKNERENLQNTPNLTCHICDLPIYACNLNNDGSKFCELCLAIDHCHACSVIRGPTHPLCNIKFSRNKDVICIIHNSAKYDTHLIFQNISQYTRANELEIEVLAKSSEKYLSFTVRLNKNKWKICFLDSINFLSTSLDVLTKNLVDYGEHHFKCLRQRFPDNEKFRLLLRKGVFPYSYVDSFAKYDESSYPPKCAFFNILSQQDISDDDYEYARKIWFKFGCKNLGEYSDLYLLTDTILLTDSFISFRNFLFHQFKLDITHFVSLPSFTFSAALLASKAEVELLIDIDAYTTIESGVRGGLCSITKRYEKANIPNMKSYNPKEPNKFIEMVDITNSYGYCMTQHLPHSDFQWVNDEDIDRIDVMQIADDAEYGYIYVCKLSYPQKLHDLHNFLPCAPTKQNVSPEQLSPYNLELLKRMNVNPPISERLITSFYPKDRYVVHYRVLKLYLSLGLNVDKIYRVLKFVQKPWLKKYVEHNTQLRNQSRSEFEKSTFKLLVNALFGRLLTNVRKFLQFKVCMSAKQFLTLSRKENFKSVMYLNENTVVCQMKRKTAYLNQLVHCGFTVLDLSKLLMYRYLYMHLLPKFPLEKICILNYDTDAFLFSVETNDLYDDLKDDCDEYYDCSTLEKSHKLYSTVNAQKLGFFKFECAKQGLIYEYVGIKPKSYSLLFYNDHELHKGKGVNKTVLKHVLRHSHYKQCLFESYCITTNCYNILSKNHQLYTIMTKKLSLNPVDVKRWIDKNGIITFAYGHYLISK